MATWAGVGRRAIGSTLPSLAAGPVRRARLARRRLTLSLVLFWLDGPATRMAWQLRQEAFQQYCLWPGGGARTLAFAP
eukprot:scaffold1919_cov394-Prasinococcus_capsulatus_cf.AAC.1